MKKLLFVLLTIFLSLSGTTPSIENDKNTVDALLQYGQPISEKDIKVVDGFLPVQGIIRDDIEIYPSTNDNEIAVMIERGEAGNITKIIRYVAE